MATLFKRDGIYYGRHVTTDPNTGKRRDLKKSFKTAEVGTARKRLARWELELSSKKWGESPSITFDEAALRFLNEHCKGLAAPSVDRYRTSIKQLSKPFDGRLIADIGKADLLAFELARRKDRGRHKTGSKWERVSPASIRRDLNCLSSIFSFAITKEWVEANPVPAFLKQRKKGGLRESPPRERYLSHEEEARLMVALQRGCRTYTGRMLHAAVVFAIDTGLREDEQLGSLWRNLQLTDPAQVFVPRGTNDKDRRVPLFERVANYVSQLPMRSLEAPVFGRKKDGRRYLSFKKGFAAACARAGIRDITWHDLRRTCGCRLLQDHEASMHEVKDWLGHKSIVQTERAYAFLKQDALQGITARARERTAELPKAQIIPMRRGA